MTEPMIEAQDLIQSVESDAPDVVRLAEVVSLAAQVEPELLRRARLELLPELDAGAEADLWFSPLVETHSVLTVMFVPDVAERLRERLFQKSDQGLPRRARTILEEVHQNAAPLVRLEEELTWNALSGEVGADILIEQRIREVLSAMVNQNRRGIARWAIGALPRLPEAARSSAACAQLALMAEKLLRGWQFRMVEDSAAPCSIGAICPSRP